VRSLIERTQDECDGLDILVNSAGIADWSNQAILDADLSQWQREVETNLHGAMILTHCAARLLSEDGGGDLVQISSGADRFFSPLHPAYHTSKWGLRGFTGSAALALREAGVRVTLLSPGEVATPMQTAEDIAAMRMLDPEDA
jgi:NAD(P)-dependent dehydrogenase (short-subunit alcohol dehydrogenase family)